MQEYKKRFIWNNFINSLKSINPDDFFNDENFEEMSIDGGENILEQYNPLDDKYNFLEENEMVLED